MADQIVSSPSALRRGDDSSLHADFDPLASRYCPSPQKPLVSKVRRRARLFYLFNYVKKSYKNKYTYCCD